MPSTSRGKLCPKFTLGTMNECMHNGELDWMVRLIGCQANQLSCQHSMVQKEHLSTLEKKRKHVT